MAKPIERIPVLTGKAAAWLEDFLRKGERPDPDRERQAQEDKNLARGVKPFDGKR